VRPSRIVIAEFEQCVIGYGVKIVLAVNEFAQTLLDNFEEGIERLEAGV